VIIQHNMLVTMEQPRATWVERWSTDPPVQVGIAAASWSIAGSYARSLLPRDPMQQAVVSGVTAAIHYQLAATSWASMQALAAAPGQRPGVRASLAISGLGIAAGLTVSAVTAPRIEQSFFAAMGSAAGRITAFSALAGGAAAVWDDLLHERLHRRPGPMTTLVPSVLTGAGVVAVSLWNRHRRAAMFGMVEPDRQSVKRKGVSAALRATAVGAGAGLGLAALTTGEQIAARGIEAGMTKVLGRSPGALGALVAHGAILGGMTMAGIAALGQVTRTIQRKDDIVEPAYPQPPTSPFVSAGPNSVMPFDAIGKEGRRFVLMALTAAEIEEVMGEPAKAPVRIVGGFEAATDLRERARMTVDDMVVCGAFDRALIAIGSPTGVGYFNYTVAEALEYLMRGDCAIVVPQYALVPSALALSDTHDAHTLTTLVLEEIKTHLDHMPIDTRPRVVVIGESLGANVALDLALNDTGIAHAERLTELGIDGGLYLGVPFRTKTWKQWLLEPDVVDPEHRMLWVSEPGEAIPIPPEQHRHLLVIHHDDPVNKYGFAMVLQPPWWMREPTSRPPLVPRESKFRPFTTFLLATVDLFNGMQSKPGDFVRRAHDYRIDARLGLERAFGLTCTPEQAERIEQALRAREQQWATRRMVSRKLDSARKAIERQLREWGDLQGADVDPESAEQISALNRLINISAPPGA
jgi:uncharacterized membrane protein